MPSLNVIFRRYLLPFIILGGLAWFSLLSTEISTPPVIHLILLNPQMSAFMHADAHRDLHRSWKPLAEISPHLQRAVVVAEDALFFEHGGFDWESIQEAARINWKRKRFSRGASTITMQVARNLFLSPKKSVPRKLKEFLIALKLERTLSKERILEIYLNIAEWAEGTYGAEAASRHYFGKGAQWLSVSEAAFLAAILPRPRYYDAHRVTPFLQKRIRSIEAQL